VSVLNILFWPAIIFGIVVGAVYLFHGKLAWWVIIVATISIIFIILLLLVVLIAMTGGSSIGPDDEYDEPSPPTEAEDQA
jgi:hypothetical protein